MSHALAHSAATPQRDALRAETNLVDRNVGVVVDAVRDVVSLGPARIHAMPSLGNPAEQRHLAAFASFEQRSIILLDVEALLGGSSLGLNAPAADLCLN